MNAVADIDCESATPAGHGWRLRVLAEIDSTNTFAAKLPAWSAVRADTQTGGRGRTRDRRWVSDAGGLWLSAVLPCPGPRNTWEILPLAAGWAVIAALRELGVSEARLRWPNDVMVGERKLAGLLVERFSADTAVVGIGLNVFNAPDHADPTLAGHAVRLADLVSVVGSLDDIAVHLLAALTRTHETILSRGFGVIADELNRTWQKPRRVAVTFTGHAQPTTGFFHGIDACGRLRLVADGAPAALFDATQVALLRELE